MMFAHLTRIAIVALAVVILVSAYRTGLALATVGVSSPQAAEILLKYYRISSIAAFCMLIPSIFLFDSIVKPKKPRIEGNAEAKS